MLNIGRKAFRNLPEQVGFLTGEVNKIWEALDGLDVYDNVIVLDALDPLSPNELDIVNKPVAFIVYNNTLYMKRGVGVDEVYFDSVFQVAESGGVIAFNSSEITVSYPLGTLSITNTSTSAYTKDKTDTLLSAKLDVTAVLDAIFPIGYIYMSTDGTSPASLFGGTWEAIEDKFLLSAGTNYTAGDTGGEATHTLTTTEMPSHTHDIKDNGDARLWYAGTRAEWNGQARELNSSLEFYKCNHQITIANTGGGSAHNNMPPYLVVYVWKRTA